MNKVISDVFTIILTLLLTTGCETTQNEQIPENDNITLTKFIKDEKNTSIEIEKEIFHTDNEDNLYHITSSRESAVSPQRALEIVSELFPNAPILELDYHWHTYDDKEKYILNIEFDESYNYDYRGVTFDTLTGECTLYYKCGCCLEIVDEPYELYVENENDIYNINTVCPDGNISMQKALEIISNAYSHIDVKIIRIKYNTIPQEGLEKYWYVEISGDIFEDGWARYGGDYVDAVTGEFVPGAFEQ